MSFNFRKEYLHLINMLAVKEDLYPIDATENLVIQEKTEEYKVISNNNSFKISPDCFELQDTTVWSFPSRGNWATHKGDYRGNWSPEIPRNIILRYSNENDTVLDPFVGSGVTLIETKLLNRKGIGVDINPEAIKIAKQRLSFDLPNAMHQELILGDSLDLRNIIPINQVDLICTHPPYANIIKYSSNIIGDLSLLGFSEFIEKISVFATECFTVLKSQKYCAVLMGDIRKNGNMIPLSFNVMQKFLEVGFVLKEIIIKQQHNCRFTEKWRELSRQHNFLLIAHEYLFVFKKP